MCGYRRSGLPRRATAGLSVGRIGVLAALYLAAWGIGQLLTGALSDRGGSKWLVAGGMWLQASALALVAIGTRFPVWALAAVLLGAGTAMVYPIADALGLRAAVWSVAALTALSGVVVAVRMYETHRPAARR